MNEEKWRDDSILFKIDVKALKKLRELNRFDFNNSLDQSCRIILWNTLNEEESISLSVSTSKVDSTEIVISHIGKKEEKINFIFSTIVDDGSHNRLEREVAENISYNVVLGKSVRAKNDTNVTGPIKEVMMEETEKYVNLMIDKINDLGKN